MTIWTFYFAASLYKPQAIDAIMNIFNFPIIARSKDLIWEHILMSVMGFIGAYALLFFSTRGDIYILEATLLKFSICIASVILCNLYVLFKNARKNQLIALNYDEVENRLHFALISQYSSRIIRKSFPLQDVRLERIRKKNLVFSTKKKSDFAVIKSSENLWVYQRNEINRGLAKLREIMLLRERH